MTLNDKHFYFNYLDEKSLENLDMSDSERNRYDSRDFVLFSGAMQLCNCVVIIVG